MSYLAACWLAMAVLLSSIVGLALLQVDLLIQLAAMLLGAAAVTVLLWPRAPWWGTRALAALADQELMQRERRRGLVAFGMFLLGAVAIGFVVGFLT